MSRRLFECFQQGIKTVRRQHMHFVNQVDLEASTGWRVLHIIQQLPGVFDLGARCRIHLNQINKTALGDFLTGRTSTTRTSANPLLAVQALSQNPGDCRFTNAPGAGEQVGMMQTLFIQSINQGAQHMLLPDHLVKKTGSPFTGKYLITH